MPKTEAGTWRDFTEQERRDLMAASLRTMTAWLAEHPDLPTVNSWEISSGTATSNIGFFSYRWTEEKAEDLLQRYADALGTQLHRVEVSEYDGYPALVLNGLVPLDVPHPNQRHVQIEMYYVIDRGDDD